MERILVDPGRPADPDWPDAVSGEILLGVVLLGVVVAQRYPDVRARG